MDGARHAGRNSHTGKALHGISFLLRPFLSGKVWEKAVKCFGSRFVEQFSKHSHQVAGRGAPGLKKTLPEPPAGGKKATPSSALPPPKASKPLSQSGSGDVKPKLVDAAGVSVKEGVSADGKNKDTLCAPTKVTGTAPYNRVGTPSIFPFVICRFLEVMAKP